MRDMGMKVLFLLQGDILREQRVGKEIETLVRAGNQVELLEVSPPEKEVPDNPWPATGFHALRLHSRHLPRSPLFLLLKYLEMVVRMTLAGIRLHPDSVHCVDRPTLLPGYLIALWTGRPFVYDSQEIFAGTIGALNRPRWLWLWVERFLARRATAVFVTDHLRQGITRNLLRLPEQKIHVIMNVPRLEDLKTCTRSMRQEAGVGVGERLVAYCGLLAPHRGLEVSIEAMREVPTSVHLALVGFGGVEYLKALKTQVEEMGLGERVHFLDPLAWNEVVSFLVGADAVLIFYPKDSLNNLYCSPSKLFDALLAGVPAVGTDNPLVREILEEHDLGICIQEVVPSVVAEALVRLLSGGGTEGRRTRAETLARTKYLWEHQEQTLLRVVNSLGGPSTPLLGHMERHS